MSFLYADTYGHFGRVQIDKRPDGFWVLLDADRACMCGRALAKGLSLHEAQEVARYYAAQYDPHTQPDAQRDEQEARDGNV